MGYWPSVRSTWLDNWPSSFFACLWTETKSRSINSQKKERSQYPAILTEQTWSKKDMLYGFRGNFSCGIQPARGVSHIINLYIQYPLINFHLHMYLDLFDTDSSNISTCFRFLIFWFISILYYMGLSHMDWELANSQIWLAKNDIDRGLDFSTWTGILTGNVLQ